MSRTSGIQTALPGPLGPSLYQIVANPVRKAVTGMVEHGDPARGSDPPPDSLDRAIEAEAIHRTGKSINHPDNISLNLDSFDKESEFYKAAEARLRREAGVSNALSWALPATVSRDNPARNRATVAQRKLHSYADIDRADTATARRLRDENARMGEVIPVMGQYRGISREARADALLREWDRLYPKGTPGRSDARKDFEEKLKSGRLGKE